MDFVNGYVDRENDKESAPTDCMDFKKVKQILENGKESAPTDCMDF
jgi:hypothetical protein